MSKAYETLKIERDENALWITLNRPQRLNTFNDVLLEELDLFMREVVPELEAAA